MGDKNYVIEVDSLTKDYGENRGIFNVDFKIEKGEVFGIVGTNGSGKTTTIRNIMGFVIPDQGGVKVMGMGAYKKAVEIKNYTAYVPGEISFPRLSSGTEFLKIQADYLQLKDSTYMNKLIDLLKLDTSADLKRMSKGMKQKTAIVAALMGDKDILILDEPTTGLDPLMREVFLDIIKEEKKRGKTVLISSHIFEELENVCDRVAMIKDGHIINIVDTNIIKNSTNKIFKVEFSSSLDRDSFVEENEKFKARKIGDSFCKLIIDKSELNNFIRSLSKYKPKSLREDEMGLENMFKDSFYNSEK